MQLRKLFTEERAVSEVIGVILLVALVVILAAVIGTYVLGVGTSNSEVGPSASFEFEVRSDYVGNDGASDTDNDGFRITHQGGDEIPLSNVEIVVDNTNVLSDSGGIDGSISGIVAPASDNDAQNPDDPWSSGESYIVVEDTDVDDSKIQNDDEVRVVWTSSNTDQSATIFKRTIDL